MSQGHWRIRTCPKKRHFRFEEKTAMEIKIYRRMNAICEEQLKNTQMCDNCLLQFDGLCMKDKYKKSVKNCKYFAVRFYDFERTKKEEGK